MKYNNLRKNIYKDSAIYTYISQQQQEHCTNIVLCHPHPPLL